MTISRPEHSHIKKHFVRLSLLIVAVVFIAMAVLAFYPKARWFYENVPIIRFKPACKAVPTKGEFHYEGYLHFLEGEPTKEFWRELHKDTYNTDLRNFVHFIDGIGYVAMNFDTPPSNPKRGGVAEERAHYHTQRVASQIVRRREQEGYFENINMSEYFVTRTFSGEVERRRSDECGFVEEFIMKGGRFATEDVSSQ